MERSQPDLSPEALWSDLRSRLAQTPDAMDPQAEVAAAAGLFDLLSNSERAALARYMYDELLEGLDERYALTPLQHAVLGLLDPYITNSDLLAEARIALSSALERADRAFEDVLAIGYGLIDLGYRVPGSEHIWTDIYERQAEDPETRYDAFDLALAGLASWNLRVFADLITKQAAEDWLIDRVDMFLPTLTRNFTPAEVSEFIQSVYCRFTDSAERKRLLLLADAYELSIAKEPKASPAQLVHSATIPEALEFALAMVASERRSDPEATSKAIERPDIHVYRSGYASNTEIDLFQNDVIDKIRDLAENSESVTASESKDFAELYSPLSLNRKLVFAFPTYLTAAKKSYGYSCASFGWQRRIGVLIPRGNRLHGHEHPAALREMLHAIMRDRGSIYCIRNYAVSEIFAQAVGEDLQLQEYFDASKITICDRRSFTPPKNTRNFVLLFDLSQWGELQQRTAASAHRIPKKLKAKQHNTWLRDATLATLTHSESVQVGIVFSKYMVDWLIEDGRWFEIATFLAARAARPAFVEAVSTLGIDVEITPPPAAVDTTRTRRLRAV